MGGTIPQRSEVLGQSRVGRSGQDKTFLAMDGNGGIDDGSELFGDATPATRYPGTGAWINAANGFEALKFPENPDCGVSQADQVFDETANRPTSTTSA